MPQGKVIIFGYRPHKLIRNPDRDIKVGDLSLRRFTLHKIKNIWVPHRQDRHRRTPPPSPLSYHPKSRVINLDKRYCPRRLTLSSTNRCFPWSNPPKRKSDPSPRLQSQNCLPEYRKNRVRSLPQIIFDRQHKTICQLSILRSRVRHCSSVRYKPHLV